jgi:hypothetical protein
MWPPKSTLRDDFLSFGVFILKFCEFGEFGKFFEQGFLSLGQAGLSLKIS